MKQTPQDDRMDTIDAAINKLADQLGVLRQIVTAERELTTRALAAAMIRIEQLEERQ